LSVSSFAGIMSQHSELVGINVVQLTPKPVEPLQLGPVQLDTILKEP